MEVKPQYEALAVRYCDRVTAGFEWARSRRIRKARVLLNHYTESGFDG